MALFVEFITNPQYGFAYGAEKVSLVTTTLPMSVFIVSVMVWGVIYDKMEFYRLRVIVNVFFFAGILVYYFSPSLTGLCIGMVLKSELISTVIATLISGDLRQVLCMFPRCDHNLRRWFRGTFFQFHRSV